MNKNKQYCYVRVEAVDAMGRKFFSQPFFPEEKANLFNCGDFDGKWLRGNLHTHTIYSHGWFSPEETKEVYQRAGYDFLAFTDHDWFEKMDKNGKTSFIYRRVPLNTDFLNDPPSFVTFSGSEQGGVEMGKDVHLLMIDCCNMLEEKKIQELIDAINLSGGFVIYHEFPKARDMEETAHIMNIHHGYCGLEIFNSSQEAVENEARLKLWDELLSRGKQVWGFANDDIHEIWWPHFKGYNMVKTRNNNRKSLKESIEKGDFYASTGLNASNLVFSEDSIYVFVPAANIIRFIGIGGKLLFEGEGNEATYDLKEKKAEFHFNKQPDPLQTQRLICHYEFINGNETSKQQKDILEERVPAGSLKWSGRNLVLELPPYFLPPALDILFLEHGFSIGLFREDLWHGAFMAFKFDAKIYNGLVRFDSRRKIHSEDDLGKIENFLKVFRYESLNKILVEMSFRVKNERDIRGTFDGLSRFFKKLKREIENLNFARLEEIESEYWNSNKIIDTES